MINFTMSDLRGTEHSKVVEVVEVDQVVDHLPALQDQHIKLLRHLVMEAMQLHPPPIDTATHHKKVHTPLTILTGTKPTQRHILSSINTTCQRTTTTPEVTTLRHSCWYISTDTATIFTMEGMVTTNILCTPKSQTAERTQCFYALWSCVIAAIYYPLLTLGVEHAAKIKMKGKFLSKYFIVSKMIVSKET